MTQSVMRGYNLLKIVAVSVAFTLTQVVFADGPMTMERLQRFFWVRNHIHPHKFPMVPAEAIEAKEVSDWLDETVALAKKGALRQGDPRVDLYNKYSVWSRSQGVNSASKEAVDLLWSQPRTTLAALGLEGGLDVGAKRLGVSATSLRDALNASVGLLSSANEPAGNGVHVGSDLFLTNAHVVQMALRSPQAPLVVERTEDARQAPTRLEASGFTTLFLDPFHDIALIRIHFKAPNVYSAPSPIQISMDPIEDGARVLSIASMLGSSQGTFENVRWICLDVQRRSRQRAGYYNVQFAGVRGSSGSPVFKVTGSGQLVLTGLFSSGGNELPVFGYTSRTIEISDIFNPDRYALRMKGQFSGINSFEHLPELGVRASDIASGNESFSKEKALEVASREARKILASFEHTKPIEAADNIPLIRVRSWLDFGSDPEKLERMALVANHGHPSVANQLFLALALDFDANWVFRNRKALGEIIGVEPDFVIAMVRAVGAKLESGTNQLAFSFANENGERTIRVSIPQSDVPRYRRDFLLRVRKQRCSDWLYQSRGSNVPTGQ